MSKKILIISNALSSLTLLPLTSIACKDKKINKKEIIIVIVKWNSIKR